MTGGGDPFEYYPRLARLLAYVKAHLSQPISLADAAQVAALEKKYFSRYFKACVGRSFSNWLLEQRIHHAIELLRDRDYPISILTFKTGCLDLRTFERRFKRVTGVTPRELRSRIREAARVKESRRAAPSKHVTSG
jgi:transcriptional regulator GlxA family with amidase domain